MKFNWQTKYPIPITCVLYPQQYLLHH